MTGTTTQRAEGVVANEWMEILCCPETGQRLRAEVGVLVAVDGSRTYPVSASGIPLFAQRRITGDALAQQQHYDRIAGAYLANLEYPHTQEYIAYLDDALKELCPTGGLGLMVEVCCGAGEGFQLLRGRYREGVGVDVSGVMLESARVHNPDPSLLFIQGDAVELPLGDASVDSVVMLGGIHHVNDRMALFSEVHRVLKPGGMFLWREPVDDFFLWRWLRAIVYRISPTLDAETEHPLRKALTLRDLATVGFKVEAWRTYGFLGYCMLMNSDVLVLTRAWKYVPGVRTFTRGLCAVDGATLKLPGLADAGLVAVGRARKSLAQSNE